MAEMPSKPGGGLTVKTFHSVESIEEIRPYWQKLRRHPNSDIDFFIFVVNQRQEILRPHVFALYRDGRPVTILAGRVEEKDIGFKIGYRTLYSSKARVLTIIYAGLLGESSDECSQALVSEIKAALKRGEADMVYMNLLPVGSDLYRRAVSAPPWLFRDHFPENNMHWQATLPASAAEFYNGLNSKRRYWFRRLEKRLAADFKDVKVRVFSGEGDLEDMLSGFEEIAKTTYHRGLGVGFRDDEETRKRFKLAKDSGWLLGYALYAAGAPCAFWAGTLYDGVFNLDYTGYKPEFRKYEPGTVLYLKMTEDLIKRKVKTLDFGFGDAFYKKHFGQKSWDESSVCIFAPTLKGLKLKLFKTLASAVSIAARAVIRRVDSLEKVKKIWRSRLLPARSAS